MVTMGILAIGYIFEMLISWQELDFASKELENVWKLPCQPDPVKDLS